MFNIHNLLSKLLMCKMTISSFYYKIEYLFLFISFVIILKWNLEYACYRVKEKSKKRTIIYTYFLMVVEVARWIQKSQTACDLY
jgi:hypothetical protein